jgi:arginase family enzyme
VANVVSMHAKNGQLPVVLGGDHSLVCVYAYTSARFYISLLTLPRPWERSEEPFSE